MRHSLQEEQPAHNIRVSPAWVRGVGGGGGGGGRGWWRVGGGGVGASLL